jgi:hypothetical protein
VATFVQDNRVVDFVSDAVGVGIALDDGVVDFVHDACSVLNICFDFQAASDYLIPWD